MMKNIMAVSLEALYTHTHTHTSRLLVNKKINDIEQEDGDET